MEQWFLEIWGTVNQETNEQGIVQILTFLQCIEVWKYVVDNDIKSYSLYQAKCVIDAT